MFSFNKRSGAVFGCSVRQDNPSSTSYSKIDGFQRFVVDFELGPWSAWSHGLPGILAENSIIIHSATAYMSAINYNRIFFTNTGRVLTSGTHSDPRILTTKTCHIRWISSWPLGVLGVTAGLVSFEKSCLQFILKTLHKPA